MYGSGIYGQETYGGESGSAEMVLLPERIEPGAITVGVAIHAPVLRTADVLEVGVLTVIVTMHELAVHEPAVPIARHVRQMAVRRIE